MKDLKKKLKKIYLIGRSPETDWQRMLTTFVVIGLLMACWSTLVFMKTKDSVVLLDSDAGSARLASENKEKELREVLDLYETKEKNFIKLQSGEVFKAPVVIATSTATTTSN